MNQKLKNKFGILLLILVTIGVLYFALKDNFHEIMNHIFTINIWWLLIAIFLVFGYWFMKSLSLHQTTKYFKQDYKMSSAFRNILVMQLFNAITPFSSGGQPYQVYALKKEGIKITDGTNIIIQSFIVYQIALVLLGIIAVLCNYFLHLYPEVGILKQLVTIGFMINFLVIVILFVVAFAKKINQFLVSKAIVLLEKMKLVKDSEQTKQNWKEYVDQFHQGASILMKDKKHFLSLILWNLIALSCLYLVPMVILFGMGDYSSLSAGITIVTSAYVMLVGAFVPIPGGTGGLEYAFVSFYGNFISGSLLKSVMLLWRFVTYYLGIMIGVIALNAKEKR